MSNLNALFAIAMASAMAVSSMSANAANALGSSGAGNAPAVTAAQDPTQVTATILTPEPDDPRPPRHRFGTLVYSLLAESGNSLDLSLISVATVTDPNGAQTREFNVGFAFEDETVVVSKFSIMPDGSVLTDSGYEFLVSQVNARPDLAPMLQQIQLTTSAGGEGTDALDPDMYYIQSRLKCALAIGALVIAVIISEPVSIVFGVIGVIANCF
jgi:hypothetical protein